MRTLLARSLAPFLAVLAACTASAPLSDGGTDAGPADAARADLGPCPTGTVCRPSAGPCDVAELCSGGACPDDSFKSAGTTCRPMAGQCDVAESCGGTSAACPADMTAPAGTMCTSAGVTGICDGLNCVTPDAGHPDLGIVPVDAGSDAGSDAGTTTDAGTDAGTTTDAGTDAGAVDAGTDAGPDDAGFDAGLPLCTCTTMCPTDHTCVGTDCCALDVTAGTCTADPACVPQTYP